GRASPPTAAANTCSCPSHRSAYSLAPLRVVPRTAPLRCAFLLGVCAPSAHLRPRMAACRDRACRSRRPLTDCNPRSSRVRGEAAHPPSRKAKRCEGKPEQESESAGPAAGRAGAKRCEGLAELQERQVRRQVDGARLRK